MNTFKKLDDIFVNQKENKNQMEITVSEIQPSFIQGSNNKNDLSSKKN